MISFKCRGRVGARAIARLEHVLAKAMSLLQHKQTLTREIERGGRLLTKRMTICGNELTWFRGGVRCKQDPADEEAN